MEEKGHDASPRTIDQLRNLTEKALERKEKENRSLASQLIGQCIAAADDGKWECEHYGTLNDTVKALLIDQGLKLRERPSGPNETSTVLSWAKH